MNPPDDNASELQNQLLTRYQKWGLSIIPINFRDKTPALKEWKPYQARQPQTGELLEWFGDGNPTNMGIICGKISGNLVVLDFDSQDSWAGFVRYCDEHKIAIYETPQTKTARGFHVWIRLRNLPRSQKIAGIDIQSEGKYVVVPPSVHPTGVRYEFINPAVSKILELNSLADLGIQGQPQVSQGGEKPPDWVAKALRGVSERERDETATRLAGYFKAKKLPLDVTIEILKEWTRRCQQPPDAKATFTPEEAIKCVRSVYRYGEPIREEQEKNIPPAPQFPEEAWIQLFGDYRDLVTNTTEASDSYHYGCFCQVLGCTLGRRLFIYHATKLYPNFYICLVGRTGLTRKDTCWRRASDILHRLHTNQDGNDPAFDILRGIGSLEGLLDALNGEGKARLLIVSELLSLLTKAKQEGLANIIPQLTELYDCPDRVNPKTRQKKIECREPFLSIMAGTTLSWLERALTESDVYGGFANRWMYFCGLPKEPLPNPPKVDPDKRNRLITRLNDIRSWTQELPNNGELTISAKADKVFQLYYRNYYQRCLADGLIPTLIVRIQDFVWKLALLYASMDLSTQIEAKHLEPAISVGAYLEQSVAEVFRGFSSSKGKQSEDKLLCYLQGKGTPIPQREVYRALNLSSAELEQTARPLERLGLIRNSIRITERGKKVRCYEAP